MKYDVIIIGGSYAGMAAALQLVRARRQVLIIDAGERRNRFASHSHGFIGQDGVDPSVIFENARAQIMRYPTLRWQQGRAEKVTGEKESFQVQTLTGESFASRRILFATGVKDRLPEIDGLPQRWGQHVFHCLTVMATNSIRDTSRLLPRAIWLRIRRRWWRNGGV